MISVLLSHPHANTVANGTAAAFARSGVLAAYVTGVAAAQGTTRARLLELGGRVLPVLRNRLIAGVPATELRSLLPLELTARSVGAVTKRLGARPTTYDAVFMGHDAAVAMMPWPSGTNAVYAYEDAALLTFRRAAKRGIERIWDLPLPHYLTLEEMWIEESKRWPTAMGARPRIEPEWRKRRKDAELKLADRITVPSAHTAESVRAAGIDAPIINNPFGFPIDDFDAKVESPHDDDRPFTVVAVGTQDLRKGTPYLLEAWRAANLKPAKLRLVGPMKLTRGFLEPYQGLFEHVPYVPRAELAREYAQADLLALPTLGDGCPQVMQEAMCCATPVVTTRCGSGPDLITHGKDGWIVPERSIDALVELFRSLFKDRSRTRTVGRAARARAEAWTWVHAGDALSAAILGHDAAKSAAS